MYRDSRSIPVHECSSSSLLFIAKQQSIVWINHYLSIHLLVDIWIVSFFELWINLLWNLWSSQLIKIYFLLLNIQKKVPASQLKVISSKCLGWWANLAQLLSRFFFFFFVNELSDFRACQDFLVWRLILNTNNPFFTNVLVVTWVLCYLCWYHYFAFLYQISKILLFFPMCSPLIHSSLIVFSDKPKTY